MDTIKQPISVFYSYADDDGDLRDLLDSHLATLERLKLIQGWHNRDIRAGIEWEKEVNTHLNTAHIVLLLISANFIASHYCYSVEMERALERHRAGETYVIPVLLRPCDFEGTPFSLLDMLPDNRKAITSWSNADEAFQNVAKGIRRVVEEFLPRTKEEWIYEGKEQHRAKNYERALVSYERALRLDGNNPRAYRSKGDALYDLRRYTEALHAYTIALRLEPGSARVYSNIASLLAHIGQYNESLAAYSQALQLTPTARLYHEKGDVLFRMGRFQEALQAYEHAIQCDANFVSAYNNKGNTLLRLKYYEEAIVAYEHVSHLDPTFALPHNNKGRALFHLGRYLESLIAYEQAILLDPLFARAYDNRAETLEQLGRTQEAAISRAKASDLRKTRRIVQ